MQLCRPERLRDGERCIRTFLCCLQFPLLGVHADCFSAALSTQTTMLNSEWLQVTYPSLGLHMLRAGHSGFGSHTWQCHSAGFWLHGWSICSFYLATFGTSDCTLSFGIPNHPPCFLLFFLLLLCFRYLGSGGRLVGRFKHPGTKYTGEEEFEQPRLKSQPTELSNGGSSMRCGIDFASMKQ
jgi:hypothetical protein